MDNRLMSIIKSTNDFLRIEREIQTTMQGNCYCIVNNDKYYREAFLEILLQRVFCDSPNPPCGKCAKCRQIEEHSNIDVLYFGDETGQIKKQHIQELLSKAIERPFESDRKFLIVKNADGLNTIDQNMLLKTIEDLPVFDTIILLFSSTEKILPTIKSRSRIFMLNTVDANLLVQLIGSSERSINILNCCEGNMGKIFELEKNKGFDECFKFAQNLLLKFEVNSDYIVYNEYLQKNKNDLEIILYIIKGVFNMAFKGKMDTFYNKDKLAQMLRLIITLEIDLGKRQNRLMIIDRLLFGLLKIKRSD